MPTTKHKKAFKEVLNGANISKAMIKADYAPSTARSTGKLTRTKGWQELMDKHLSDSLLAKRHRELLNKTESGQPHSDVKGALDMAYKLKGSYAAEKHISLNVELSKEDLDEGNKAIEQA